MLEKSPGHAGKEGPQLARTGASQGFPRAAASSPLTQHQPYIPYMHGYSYSQSYDPSHPSYRGMPAVMMQNYPGTVRSPAAAPVTGKGNEADFKSSFLAQLSC